jgi:predicted permease
MYTLLRDARYAARVLGKSPAFTLTAVATLAVAIGINTAVFSLVDGVLLKPLPYPQPDRLGLVETTARAAAGADRVTAQHGSTWEVVRDAATTVDRAVFSSWTTGVNIVAGTQARHAEQQRVGAGFFRVLGVPPLQGREFTDAEDRRGGPQAVIVSHDFWYRTLDADPAAVGRTINLRGEPHTLVGVMPQGFHSGVDADLWTPLRATRDGEGDGENFRILLRLRDGLSWTQANAELERLGADILRQRPVPAEVSVAFGAVPFQNGMTRELRQPLTMVASSVAVVLLVAAVNLAGLLLSRGARRTREIATRLALGSGRGGVIRQLLAESLLLAALGATAGVGVAWFTLDALRPSLEIFGVWQPIAVDARAALAAAVLALITTAMFGIIPAIQATRMDVQSGLATSGTRSVTGAAAHWPRRALVAAQVALGVVLLVAAGLLVRSFAHLQHLDPGFRGRDVYTATISLQDARYRTSAQVMQLFDATLARIRQTPGIASAAVSLGLPYERLLNLGFRHLDGPEASAPRGKMTTCAYIAGDYFATLGIGVRAGRTFDARDTTASPGVVIVNETFAREYFNGGNPVGHRIALAGRDREIVGLVGDVQLKPSLGGERSPLAPMPLAYIPLAQVNDGMIRLVHGWFSPSFIVRASNANAVTAIRSALDASDPLLPFAKVRAMEEVQSESVAQPRLYMTLMLVLSGATVLLVAVGLYGLIASSVAERTREIGIRLALGATSTRAVRSLAMPGLALALAGAALGLVLARAASSLLSAFIFGIRPTDVATYTAVTLLLLTIAAIASVLPALRVVRIDPASTLRME